MHGSRRVLFVLTVTVASGLVSAGAYAWLRVQAQALQLTQLQRQNAALNDETLVWQQRWQEDTRRRDEQIARLEQTLQGLRDAQQLKQQLVETQGRLAQVETDYERITREKESLEAANVSLNSRTSNLTKEMSKTLDDLKVARQQLSGSQIERITAQFTREVEGYKQQLKERDAAIAGLESHVRQLRGDAAEVSEGGRVAERQLSTLQQEKEKLTAKIEQLTRSYEERLAPVSRLKEKIRALEKESGEKDKQRQALERELAAAEENRRNLERKFENAQKVVTELQAQALKQGEAQRAQQQEFESLKDEKIRLSLETQKAEFRLNAQTQEIQNLRRELARLDSDLASQKGTREQIAQQLADARQSQGFSSADEGKKAVPGIELANSTQQEELSKAYALYDTAKAQVVKFSEMMMEREMELERTKQQLAAAQGKPGSETRPPENISAVVSEKERQLQAKDIELAELRQLKVAVEEQMKKREQEYGDLNADATKLKEQMIQMNEILVRRESDLVSKSSEVVSLRSQLDRLQSDLSAKQKELEQVRERQSMTLEELAKATRLNVTLQENLVQMYKNSSPDGVGESRRSDDREKADALRREVEKLLKK